MEEKTKNWKKFWTPGVTDQFNIEKPISEYLRDISKRYPDQTAIHFYGTCLSYKTLNNLIDQFAWGLVELGLMKGDRVVIQMPNCPQYIISYFGILRAGGVVVAMNPMFKSTELEYEIKDSTPIIFICADYLYKEVAKVRAGLTLKNIIITSLNDYIPEGPSLPLPAEVQKEECGFADTIPFQEVIANSPIKPICRVTDLKSELALLQYTGGTTGMPKGAMISHHGLALAALGANNWFDMTSRDICMGVAPFFHIMGMVQVMCSPLSSGAELVVISRFIPETVARAISEYKCTAWVSATTMLIALLQLQDIEKYDFSPLRFVVSGGASISMEIQNRFSRLIPKAVMIEGYGLTESISQGAAITPIGGHRPGLLGVPHLNDMKIVDMQTGEREMPPGEEGEIVLKGNCLMQGYWQQPAETQRVFRNKWLYTGDIGSINEDGYLKLSGRNKELMKCSGYSVFPDEVENLMYRYYAISEVVVIRVPDPYRGESPKAFIVLQPQYKGKISKKEVFKWCKENMAAYKCPSQIEFTDNLPKSAAGKVLRRLLK